MLACEGSWRVRDLRKIIFWWGFFVSDSIGDFKGDKKPIYCVTQTT